MDMCARNLKRKATEEIMDEDVHIVIPPTPKKEKTAIAKNPWKKNAKDVEEHEESGSKN